MLTRSGIPRSAPHVWTTPAETLPTSQREALTNPRHDHAAPRGIAYQATHPTSAAPRARPHEPRRSDKERFAKIGARGRTGRCSGFRVGCSTWVWPSRTAWAHRPEQDPAEVPASLGSHGRVVDLRLRWCSDAGYPGGFLARFQHTSPAHPAGSETTGRVQGPDLLILTGTKQRRTGLNRYAVTHSYYLEPVQPTDQKVRGSNPFGRATDQGCDQRKRGHGLDCFPQSGVRSVR